MNDELAFTGGRLLRLCQARGRFIRTEVAASYAAALEAARPIADLSTTTRVCQFIGQIGTETGGFGSLVESLAYRTPARLAHIFSAVHGTQDATNLIAAGEEAIANRVYANRNGNGDEASGDGWTFRGRGFIMLTGRANYMIAARDSKLDLVENPALLGRPSEAAIAAMYYWKVRNINSVADAAATKAVTARVNPALVGLDDRVKWVAAARSVWLSDAVGRAIA